MVTHGPDHPEQATIPFVMAGAALASDVARRARVPGQRRRARQDAASRKRSRPTGSRRCAKLLDDVRELGAQLLVCGPCIKSRGIVAPDDLVAGAEVVAAGRFMAEITSATNSLVY